MRACIHRGSKQIGGSCVELETGGKRLVLDLGLPLDAANNDAVLLPGIRGIDGNDPSLCGILISHPHLDHYGLLAHVSRRVPIGLGRSARRILQAASSFVPGDWPVPASGWDYESETTFNVGPFQITPYLVDHSAYDAYSLLIEADGKRIFYSGDFRAHGRKSRLFDAIVKRPPTRIDALLVEGSSLSRLSADATFPNESDIEAKLVDTFRETAGLALVHASVQNIDRLVSIFRAAKKSGRTLVIDLYAAALLEATGNASLPQSDWDNIALFVPHAQRLHIKKNSLFELLSRHSAKRIYQTDLARAPHRFTLLFRPLHCSDLDQAKCLTGASYVYSQWEGYWNHGTYDKLKAWIDRQGIVPTMLHTSGHASPRDLKTFVKALDARKVVPIHSFRPDLYAERFDNVEPHADGEWWDL
ncbi:MBL fold metallo-hydrolase [Paraburkholderia sp. Tr-20389]|uniref:MBL fold metallo-hydrolase n=1 Tax=Paraburkholderia sp. Tr-20389 TaxID=2703903 RepID=UPI00197DEDD0|nr:MBL fold metallo-hydrolase [Paraburkholderia sp. Tr-20389]MBN3751779.1 MBL fold metallo-hydrolase [Paraburkholderia sp. Tr-20389]